MRIWFAGDAHHLPVEPFDVNVGDGWDIVGFLRFGVVGLPSLFIAQVGFEVSKEAVVEEDLAAFEFLPGAIWSRGRNAMVDVA